MGRSYGGYMTAWIIFQTSRFKVASLGAGMSDLVSFYGQTDIPGYTEYYLGDVPWRALDRYLRRSPVTYGSSFQTPTLILHGSCPCCCCATSRPVKGEPRATSMLPILFSASMSVLRTLCSSIFPPRLRRRSAPTASRTMTLPALRRTVTAPWVEVIVTFPALFSTVTGPRPRVTVTLPALLDTETAPDAIRDVNVPLVHVNLHRERSRSLHHQIGPQVAVLSVALSLHTEAEARGPGLRPVHAKGVLGPRRGRARFGVGVLHRGHAHGLAGDHLDLVAGRVDDEMRARAQREGLRHAPHLDCGTPAGVHPGDGAPNEGRAPPDPPGDQPVDDQ